MSQERRQVKVPAALLWREFRMRFLPVCVFTVGLVAAFMLWKMTVIGPTMVGAVEGTESVVTAPNAGVVTNLLVRANQLVKKDQPVALLLASDYRAVSAQVQDLRSRIAMSQLEIGAILNRDRLENQVQTMAMDTLRFRAELAAAEAELPTVEAAFERNERGFKAQVVPYNDYEISLRERDSMRARVTELKKLVQQAEKHLADASKTSGGRTTQVTANLDSAVRSLSDARRELEESRNEPIILRSPIDGVVGQVVHREGENVQPGDVILVIRSLEGNRILTYVRQGSPFNTKRGAPVTVRCRTQLREEAVAKVEDVGYHYEPITNQALLQPGRTFELGMPVGISIPAGLRQILRPGEVVDLAMER